MLSFHTLLDCNEISCNHFRHRCDEAITLESWRLSWHWHRYHKRNMIRFGLAETRDHTNHKKRDITTHQVWRNWTLKSVSFLLILLERLWTRRRWMKKQMGSSSPSCYNQDNIQILLGQGLMFFLCKSFMIDLQAFWTGTVLVTFQHKRMTQLYIFS